MCLWSKCQLWERSVKTNNLFRLNHRSGGKKCQSLVSKIQCSLTSIYNPAPKHIHTVMYAELPASCERRQPRTYLCPTHVRRGYPAPRHKQPRNSLRCVPDLRLARLLSTCASYLTVAAWCADSESIRLHTCHISAVRGCKKSMQAGRAHWIYIAKAEHRIWFDLQKILCVCAHVF